MTARACGYRRRIAPAVTDEASPPAWRRTPPDPLMRLFGVVLALVMALGALVMAITMDDLAGTPTCSAVRSGAAAIPSDRKCFAGSEARRSAVLGMGIAGAASAAAAAVLAVAFALRGGPVRLLAAAIALALALVGLSILVGAA